eukprot:525703_1
MKKKLNKKRKNNKKKKNKYKYKKSMINGMKQLYNNVNDNDSDSDNESSDNNSIININELPNYTNEGIDAMNEIYNKFINIPNQSTYKNMSGIINNKNKNNFKYFDDGLSVNKLISFTKYINEKQSQIFNDNDINQNINKINLNDVDLDYNIKSKNLKKKLHKM